MKVFKRICIVIVVLLMLWAAAFATDYFRVITLGKRPVFCLKTSEN